MRVTWGSAAGGTAAGAVAEPPCTGRCTPRKMHKLDLTAMDVNTVIQRDDVTERYAGRAGGAGGCEEPGHLGTRVGSKIVAERGKRWLQQGATTH